MNIKDLFRIFDKFSKSTIDEMKLEDGNFRLSLKKNIAPIQSPGVFEAQPASPVSALLPQQSPPAAPTPSDTVSEEKTEAESTKEDLSIITSPIVGTFYRAPAPDAPPFVTEGAQVSLGKTLAVIEAMKVMNHLEAEFDMEIVSILIKNGEMVEFGTPLFEVRST